MKYIIGVPEEIAEISEEFLSKAGLLCEPYTESDRKAIEDEVWEFAKTVYEVIDDDNDIFFGHSYHEMKERYEAWLKQKGEIHVGDEVLNRLGKPYVIYEIKNDSAYGIMFDEYPLNQECFYIYDTNKKTGRHFPEVAQLLEKMRRKKNDSD